MIERNVTTCIHQRYYSSRETARIFSEDDKCAILSVMALATDKLLRIKKPLNIKRVSYDKDVPDKALGEHYLASGVMTVHGYIVQKCDVWNGKRVLLANLRLQTNLFFWIVSDSLIFMRRRRCAMKREQQIKFIESARERLDANFAERLRNPEILEALSKYDGQICPVQSEHKQAVA